MSNKPENAKGFCTSTLRLGCWSRRRRVHLKRWHTFHGSTGGGGGREVCGVEPEHHVHPDEDDTRHETLVHSSHTTSSLDIAGISESGHLGLAEGVRDADIGGELLGGVDDRTQAVESPRP
jgi:hypothetical protein